MSKKTDKHKRAVVFYYLSIFIKKNYSKFFDIREVFLNFLNPDDKYNREDRNMMFSRFLHFFKIYLDKNNICFFYDKKTNCYILFKDHKHKQKFFEKNIEG